jgi:nicotinamide-nucleotide amidase
LICETADGKVVYAVAGVPAEMREMMEGTILPELVQRGGGAAIVSRVLRCTGIAESKVAEILDDLFASNTNPTVAYLASSGEVKVRLTAKAVTRGEAEDLIAPLAEEVARRLAPHVFTTGDEDLEQVVGRELRARRRTVACAESLTGGGLASRLTRAPGASEYFLGSAVTYTADSKRDVLGVSQETIDGPGVVSEECAREMAAGARKLFGADVGVALTGVAGPESHGGQPPGQVWLAIDADDAREVRGFRAPGDRDQVRRWAEQGALDILRRYLQGTLST